MEIEAPSKAAKMLRSFLTAISSLRYDGQAMFSSRSDCMQVLIRSWNSQFSLWANVRKRDGTPTRFGIDSRKNFTNRLIELLERPNDLVEAEEVGTWEQVLLQVSLTEDLSKKRNKLVEALTEYREYLRSIELEVISETADEDFSDALQISQKFDSERGLPPSVFPVTEWNVAPENANRSLGQRYLFGARPNLTTAIEAAVQRTNNIELFEGRGEKDAIILHGSFADGLSTCLLQAAYRLFLDGRRVLLIPNDGALLETRVFPDKHSESIFVYDDEGRLATPPYNLVFRGAPRCKLLIATPSWNLKQLTSYLRRVGLSVSVVAVPRIGKEDVNLYVDKICGFGAHPSGLSREAVYDLFLSGLFRKDGYGGLWPAQYQATHGIDLEERVADVLGDLDSAETIALGVIVASNFFIDAGQRGAPPVNTDLIDAIMDALEFSPDFTLEVKEKIFSIHEKLTSEIRDPFRVGIGAYSSRALFLVRHPALTECFFRWIFGANNPDRGRAVLEKWKLYEALFRALLDKRVKASHDFTIRFARQMYQNMKYDLSRENLRSLMLDQITDPVLFFNKIFQDLEYHMRQDIVENEWIKRRYCSLFADFIDWSRSYAPEEDLGSAEDYLIRALDRRAFESDPLALCYVASVGARFGWNLEGPSDIPLAQVNASTLISRAWDIASGQTKKRVARYCLILFTRHKLAFEPDFIAEVVEKGDLASDDRFWSAVRLEILVGLLTLVSQRYRALKNTGRQSDTADALLKSHFVSRLILAFWREAYRCMAVDPNFDFKSAVRQNDNGVLISPDGHAIRKALEAWSGLIDLEFALPTELKDPMVAEAINKPSAWCVLFQRFDDLYSFKSGNFVDQ